MRPIIQEIKSKFSGTDVFIIGGGYSLNDFDFSRLDGRNVIAINSAYKNVGESAIIYWADSAWGTDNSANLEKHPSKYKFSSRLNIDSALKMGTRGPGNCHWLKKTGSFGYDPNIDNVRGNNSGGNAINFAINLGAARIFLLGFDMGYIGSKSHFHDDYTTTVASSTYTDTFIPSIDSLAKEVRHLPVKIINCFEHSKLKCFEFGDIEDYI